ncbi:MAG TPA: hypothetical protein VHT53_02470 [Candidatus Elarobacter sp.]|jgi:hypothetical protein|nr:hypothetical protein [Candidatus Elarobacter sp.]
MKQPINVTYDPRSSHAYVEYADTLASASWVAVYREADGSVEEYGARDGRTDEPLGVIAEFDARDDIVAIEIIATSQPDLMSIARDYAAENDLAFPDDLCAAAAAFGDPAA